jgi:hypothetical protein
VRLRALIGDRRIVEPALRRHDRTVDIAIADLSVPLHRFGYRLQERIPVLYGQWTSRIEDGADLTVAQSDWPHVCPVVARKRGGLPAYARTRAFAMRRDRPQSGVRFPRPLGRADQAMRLLEDLMDVCVEGSARASQ